MLTFLKSTKTYIAGELAMQLEINNRQAGIADDSFRKVVRLLWFSLSRFSGIISRVRVNFFDVNGPKGGLDKRCRITAKMNAAGQVVVQNDGQAYIEALSLSLDKLIRAIRRDVDRRRTMPIRKSRICRKTFIYNLEESIHESQAEIYQEDV